MFGRKKPDALKKGLDAASRFSSVADAALKGVDGVIDTNVKNIAGAAEKLPTDNNGREVARKNELEKMKRIHETRHDDEIEKLKSLLG